MNCDVRCSGRGKLPISVIVPCFNNESYIEQCIKSINESSPPDEIIVVDDSSKDNSARVVEELCTRHPNIVLVKKRTNEGAAAARLTGIRSARNSWIALVDADDYIEIGALSDAYEKAQLQSSDICVWTMWRFSSEQSWPQITFSENEFPKSGKQAVIATLGSWKIHPLGVSKKELYIRAYDAFSLSENPLMNADELITRLVFENARKVVFSSRRYFYRVNSESTTLKRSMKQLTTLRADVWLMNFAKRYEEVSPRIIARGLIGKAWRFHMDREYYGAEAVRREVEYALAAMHELAPPRRWIWRYPKHWAGYLYLRLKYSAAKSGTNFR